MTLINTTLKPFKTTAYHNGKFVEVTDQTVRGKWSVFIFMPAAFTFNCPTEVEDAADNYAEFQKMGAEVYVVTTDTHFSHKVWHETSPAVGKAKFPLVGDPTHTLTRAFGAGPVSNTHSRPLIAFTDRRSCVAALFIAPTTDASECVAGGSTVRSSNSLRTTDP